MKIVTRLPKKIRLVAIAISLILINVSLLLQLNTFNLISDYIVRTTRLPAYKNIILSSNIDNSEKISGSAWSDVDGDGWVDLAVFGGREGVRLYKNVGGENFKDLSEKSVFIKGRGVWAGAFADYDNDGCQDLYLSSVTTQQLASVSTDHLFRNNCDGTFLNVSKTAGINDNFNGRGVAWADYNSDGYLDIYVANHGKFDTNNYIFEPNVLYRNDGDGRFTNVTERAGVTGVAKCSKLQEGAAVPKNLASTGAFKQSFQPIWFDFNNDGLMDLFVTVDSGVSVLYRNDGGEIFSDVTDKAGLCRIGTGMGVAVGDYDNDGDLDMYVTNTGANFLWRNNGNETFSEIARSLDVADSMSLGWGTSFLDYDNDGLLDLHVTNGTVNARIDFNPSIGKIRLDRLYKNIGSGSFTEVSELESLSGDDPKEATAMADFNNDGFIDIFVASSIYSKIPNHRLYKNQKNNNNWLNIKLVGTISNRDAVGARITIRSGGLNQIREVRSGESYISQHSLVQTFGLSKNSKIDHLEIRWPSGKFQTLSNLPVNQTISVTEPK